MQGYVCTLPGPPSVPGHPSLTSACPGPPLDRGGRFKPSTHPDDKGTSPPCSEHKTCRGQAASWCPRPVPRAQIGRAPCRERV